MESDARSHTDQAPEESGPPADGRGRLSVGAILLRSLYVLLSSLVVLILLILVLLQTNWGAQYFSRTLLGLLDPFGEARIEIDETRGNFISNLDLRGLRLVRVDSLGERSLVEIDTLRLNYSLRGIFSRRLRITDLYIASPRVQMQQQEDGSWDLINILPVPDEVDTTANAFLLELDNVVLRNGSLRAEYFSPGRDSTLLIDDLNTRIRDVGIADDFNLSVDTLWMTLRPPGEGGPVDARLAGRLFEGHLDLDELRLESDVSDVVAAGTLRLPNEEADEIHDIDFRIEGEPLAFRDIRPFLPTLDPDRVVELDARIGGTSGLMNARISGTFDDGSSVFIEGDITPNPAGPVEYRAVAELRRFDPAMISGGDLDNVRVTGDVRADLQGTQLDQLNGTLRGVLFDSRFGDYAPDRTVLDATFEQGTATVDLRSGLRGATFWTTGTMRPFDETLSYSLRGRIETLDIYRFNEGEGTSDITGNFRLEGRGFDRHADLSLNLFLDPSTMNGYQVNDGTLDLRYRQEQLSGSARLVTEDGFVALQGELQLDDPMRYRISRGRAENFDLASLLGQEGRSSLTGTFSGSGFGTDPTALVLSADIRVEPSFYNEVEIRHALARASMNQGTLRLNAEADLVGGSFDVSGVMQPFANRPPFQISEASFRNVDIGALTGSDQSTDLTGSFEGAGRGFEIETMSLDGNLSLSGSRYNQQQINEAVVNLTLRSGSAQFDGRVVVPEGRAQLAGSIQPFLERPVYAIESGSFSGLDLGLILDNPDLDTRLAGEVQLDGQGFDPQSMALTGRLDLAESIVNRERINSASLEADIRNGFAQLEAEIDLSAGFVRADARGRFFDEQPSYETEGSFSNLDLARLIGADTLQSSLSGTFEIQGRGFDLQTMVAEGVIRADNSQYDRIDIQRARAGFVIFDGLVQVDSLDVRSNVLDLTGAGQLALFDTTEAYQSDFRFAANFYDLDPLRPVLGIGQLAVEEGHVEARVYGQPGEIQFDASAGVSSLVYEDIRVAGFQGEIAGSLTPGLQLRMAETRGEVDFFAMNDFSIQTASYDVSIDGEQVEFIAEAMVDARRDVRLRGSADLSPDGRRMVLEDLNLRLDEDRWELLQEATIEYGDEIRIRNLLLFSQDQQIAVDGVINPDGDQNLVMTIENFRIDAVADLAGYRGLGGVVDGFADLTGPAEAPRLSGQLQADLTSDGRDVGAMDLELDYDSLRLGIDAELTHDDGSRLTAVGGVPLDLRLVDREVEGARPGVTVQAQEGPAFGEVDIDIVSQNFSINWLMPFMDRETIDQLDGRLVGTMHVGGSLSDPVLAGDATLRQGVVRLPEIGIQLQNVEVDAAMSENQVNISRASANSGGGSASARGSLDFASLTDFGYDLRINANRFLAADNPQYRVVTNADLRLTGSARQPVLRGDVTILNGDIYLTEETTGESFQQVELSSEDVRMLEQRFGIRLGESDTTTFDFYEALTMNLSVRTERNTWIRSRQTPSMDIQFTGRLDVSKQPLSELVIFGDIEVIPERSRIRQFGRTFDITTGTLQFNGSIADMLLDLEAEYRVRARRSTEEQVVIVLGVAGRLDSLDLNLESRNPPGLDMADIVSYIATNRPANETLQLGGQGSTAETIGQLGASAFLTQVTGWVENVAGEELGLDVIEIEQTGLEGTRITAGKYLTPRLFVSVSEAIGIGSDEVARAAYRREFGRRVTFEYEVTNWLLTRLIRDDENLRVTFLWEYSY